MVARHYSEEEITDLLFRAVNKDYYRTTELALLSGADYEKEKSVDHYLSTPLIFAARDNYPRIVSLLLKYGADPNHKAGIIGDYPLTESIIHNDNPLIVKLLLDAGARIEEKMAGGTALMEAITNRRYKTAEYLIDRGANVNAVSVLGDTMLIGAVMADVPNLDIIRRLLENGANVNIKNNWGDDALSLVLKYDSKNKELITLLTSYRDFYMRENQRMILEHMIPDLARITRGYLD